MGQNQAKIKENVALLPEKPGVYLMKNRQGTIIYVGKAKILKNRVRSYFTESVTDRKTQKLVKQIADFDYIVTQTEKQAFILENNLIKKHKPKYNVMLKDDKQYPFIKITWKEPFPRIFITRELQRDGNRYYGPFTDVKTLRKTMRMLEWIFPYRTCSRMIPENEIVWQRSCINEQLGKCPAPCIGSISKAEYRKTILQIVYFLKGKNEKVITSFRQKMQQYAQEMQYENAAAMRDKIQNIQRLNRYQNMYFTDEKNRDVIGIYKEENKAAVAVLKILSGKLLNKEIYSMENVESESTADILEAFLKQYYSKTINKLPFQIILQEMPGDFSFLNELLHQKIIVPQRGELKALQVISKENAFNFIEENKLRYMRKSNRTILPVQELKDVLQLKKLPRKICCFDISTIQGSDTVASMVYFENGKPQKKNYRHFIIKTVQKQDDYAALKEAVLRYLESIDPENIPDLMVIDGGKGQLSSVAGIVAEKAPVIELISLAKRLEEIFLPNHKDSIILTKTSSALRLLIRLRDEAHRFAVTFHRKRRTNRMLSSELDSIKGLGDELKFVLLKEFGSIEKMKEANLVELMKIKGIGEKMAKKIKENLKK